MKPGGTIIPIKAAPAINAAYRPIIKLLCPMILATPWLYDFEPREKTWLKIWKNVPKTRSIARVSQSFGASALLKSSAANAGERVKELNAEITVEIAIVMANCL